MNKRRVIDLIILVIVLIFGYFTIKNAIAIGDWLYFRNYTPTAEVEKIANDAGMNDEGKKLFYRLDPQFVDRQTINDECGTDALGCTVGKNIYILNDFTPRQYNRSIVTAAHEMLHVAWSRLSDEELANLKADLDDQIEFSDSDLVKKFRGFTGDDYYNEAHSYIGTEEPDLSSDLKTHYERYFSDRANVIKALNASPEG